MSEVTQRFGSPPGSSAPPFEQVVSLCADFTGEWAPERRPSIPSYLIRAGDEARETLLRNLLVNEIQRRRLVGETPRAEEYIEQLPTYASLVRRVFLESTSAGSTGGAEPASGNGQAGPPAADRLGDYRLLRELGRGGMGVVYEALHVARPDRVALKILPRVDGPQLYRFKREFRSAAGLSHPNLIGLHTLECDGAQWFFTMDLVEGVDFLEHVRPAGRLDGARLRPAFGQLAMGVMALHRNHIIHRDLKPSNVMVAQDGRVILLDFGLVVELEQAGASQSRDKIAGTPAYMAPEQATGATVTAASDWYAVGTMLYEALCGQRPFAGSLWEILRDKQALDPPPLPLDEGPPEDLARLCMQLLARDPGSRPDALEIARRISADVGRPEPAAVASGGHRLIGRDHHLAALQEVYRTLCRRDDPQTVFILGRSGEGKTALAEHFLASLRQDRTLAVMTGRCYDRESVPFKALDSLIDALASYLRGLPETDAALLMPDDIGLLAQVFPVLQRAEVVARAGAGRLAALDEQQARQRAFAALRSLLGRISRRSAIVWFVDDLQWGDADSAGVLFEVLRTPEAPRVLFVGTYRSDEAEGSAFLAAWKGLQRQHNAPFADVEVKLGPLTVEECTELVVRLLDRDDERIRRRAIEFAQETRGNPFLLIELAGCFDPESDAFEAMPLHEVIGRKLGRLPREAGRLLEVVAVSGQALPLDEASRAAGDAAPTIATLTRMRNERLVRLIGPEDRPLVDTYHDRVRETIRGGLDDGVRRGLHGALAEVIERGVGAAPEDQAAGLQSWEGAGDPAGKDIPRVYDLAYHFDAAGDRRRAWIYALLAGEQARRQAAPEVAAHNFAIARRNADGTPGAVRYRIAEGYGGALMFLGRYDEALRETEGAIDLADDPERKARIEALQGEIFFRRGSIDRSIVLLESGLRRLGYWVPRTRYGYLCGIVREVAVQCVHTLRPAGRHRRRASRRLELAIQCLLGLQFPVIFSNTIKLLWVHLSGMNLAELSPPSRQQVLSYAYHNCLLSMLGWHGRGSRYGDRAIAMAREFDDLLVLGHSCGYKGVGLYASARYEDSLASLNEAIEAYERAGDRWELNLAHFHRGCCHFGLGNLAEAVAEARGTFAASARLGDARVLCSSYLWARATGGNLPFDELRGCHPDRPDDIMSTVHGLMAEGHWHTFHGRTAEAVRVFERAGELVRKSLCVNSHTILSLPNLAGALRRHADAVQSDAPGEAARLRRRALRLAKWAARITRLFPAAYPLSLREVSLQLADRGQLARALRIAEESCTVALRQKARYEHAQSLLVRGRIARRLGRPEAERQIRTAEAELDEIERPVRSEAPSHAGAGPA